MINLEKYPNVEWVLPLLFEHEAVYAALVDTFKQHNLTFPKTEIYGCPECKWSGGRWPVVHDVLNAETLHKIFSYVKIYNGNISLTFSNTDIVEDDLKDEYCNLITDIALQYDASFIVSSDVLLEHLKNKGAKRIKASVIKSYFDLFDVFDPNKELEYYNELLKRYDIVVVRPEFSKHYLINGYDQLDTSRIEVLINSICTAYCRQAKEHYRNYQNNKHFQCKTGINYLYGQADESTTLIHTPDQINKLISLGVNKLKSSGRGLFAQYYHMIYLMFNQLFNIEGEGLRLYYLLDNTLEHKREEFYYYVS